MGFTTTCIASNAAAGCYVQRCNNSPCKALNVGIKSPICVLKTMLTNQRAVSEANHEHFTQTLPMSTFVFIGSSTATSSGTYYRH